MSRRRFLKVFGATGASLVVGIYLGGCDEAEEATATTGPAATLRSTTTTLVQGTLQPNIFLRVAADGAVTVTAFRSEMGQGIRTAIAMILAEELDADWRDVTIEQAPADSRYGDQITGGSESVSTIYSTLREAGAATRWMLVEAAARRWDVRHEDCTTVAGAVVHPDGSQTLGYGALAGAASLIEPPESGDVALKDPTDFRIIGSDLAHFDGPNIVTGRAIYGADIRRPDMVYATLARCPTFDGRLRGFESAAALAVEGVIEIFALDAAVVVVAGSTWSALSGKSLLEIDWDLGPNAELTSESIWADIDSRLVTGAEAGEIEATYRIPYQAHQSMEPMNCVAEVGPERCDVWAPTQDAQRVKRSVASAIGMAPEEVTVHVPLIGGGFGRRLEPDYAVEAARISKEIGRPVQVLWTREDDLRHDFYHPLSQQYARATPGVDERPTVRSIGGGGYVPTGAWRSVTNHHDAFVNQCFIDEMAGAMQIDPLEFRRRRYGGRALAVVELAAQRADWGEALPAGWGRGIAYHALFGVTDVAMVAEVEVAGGEVRVHRMVAAVDCGQVVNPNNVIAQIEGGIAFGLTAALKGGVTLEAGRIVEGNFDNAPILLMREMPAVEVHLIESADPPSGVGEAGVPPVAPAVANAVFAATGKRVRSLPIVVSTG